MASLYDTYSLIRACHSEREISLSFGRKQLKALKLEATRGRPYWDRISVALAFRLLDTSSPYFNSFSVLDELDYLEGIRKNSFTKAEEQFKHNPLHPLWHKHFFLPKHVFQNVGVRWNLLKDGNKDITKIFSEVAENYGDYPDVWPDYLAHRLVVRGFKEREERGLTGDWIVFGKQDENNFYLDLAAHEEGEGCNAVALLQRIRNGSQVEFPFLFE